MKEADYPKRWSVYQIVRGHIPDMSQIMFRAGRGTWKNVYCVQVSGVQSFWCFQEFLSSVSNCLNERWKGSVRKT